MKPPGGESKLNLKEDEDGEVQEEELEERCVRWEQECFVSKLCVFCISCTGVMAYGLCTYKGHNLRWVHEVNFL